MRILLFGMGSRGDVEPMLALGCRLEREGYAVSLAAAADFRDLVVGRGLDFEPFSFDVQAGATSDLGRRWLGGSSASQRREAVLMRQVVRAIAEPLAEDLVRLVEGADAFVVSALTFEAMEPLARRAGKPLVHVMFQPIWPTRYGPSATFALRPARPSSLNLAWSWAAAFAAWDVFRSPGAVMRRRLGMPRASFRAYVAAARRTPTIFAASPHVVPPAADWGPAIRQTGFWYADPDRAWTPPGELDAFLGRAERTPTPAGNLVAAPVGCAEPAGSGGGHSTGGSPVSARSTTGEGQRRRDEYAPVYLGFGSMPTDQPERVVWTFLEALQRVGRRGVISAGWARLHAADLPGTVLPVGEVPHSWLFPRMGAVVHHGGAGTTAAAFRAGVPQVVVPHIADQPYWGRRVQGLGVGPAPIHRKDLDVDRLVAALEVALAPGASSAAYDLGARIRSEDGVGDAAALVASLLS